MVVYKELFTLCTADLFNWNHRMDYWIISWAVNQSQQPANFLGALNAGLRLLFSCYVGALKRWGCPTMGLQPFCIHQQQQTADCQFLTILQSNHIPSLFSINHYNQLQSISISIQSYFPSQSSPTLLTAKVNEELHHIHISIPVKSMWIYRIEIREHTAQRANTGSCDAKISVDSNSWANGRLWRNRLWRLLNKKSRYKVRVRAYSNPLMILLRWRISTPLAAFLSTPLALPSLLLLQRSGKLAVIGLFMDSFFLFFFVRLSQSRRPRVCPR